MVGGEQYADVDAYHSMYRWDGTAWTNPLDCVTGAAWCVALARTGPATTDRVASFYDW